MKLIVLGCGTSTGVPRIGNDWGDCDPNEPKNRRLRVSIIVESEAGARLLVDTSPDLRQQLLTAGIDKVDGVFWTHDHADHCHGIDDLRVMRYDRSNPLPGYATKGTAERLRRRFDYVFAGQHGYPTIVELKTLDEARLVAGFAFEWIEMSHGPARSTGYRFEADGKTISYATDFDQISEDMVDCFADSDILVCDCLRMRPHQSHAHYDMAIELGRRAGVGRLVLTHLDKSMDYRTLVAMAPANVIVGYDTLVIKC